MGSLIKANRHLPLYLSAPHDCSYLPDRQSSTLFADPEQAMDMATYSELLHYGFRRSGKMVYTPRCENCRECVSVRVPVADFSPRRSQRRVLQANADIEMREHPAAFNPQHYALYQRYTAARHEDGDMADASSEDYLGFLCAPWCDTRFFEFHIGGRLVAVAVTDMPADGLSAVYTFFDPELAPRSLGTFAILRQIAHAQALGLPYLYLGYWIRDSRKMAYKVNFRPIELWREGQWRRLEPSDPLPI
ncbi:MAG: arginyltransferase [Gammaproteobacteria bacterium]|nr:arginyltransferase [Gammaproteobacteria bacterium]